MGVVGKLKKALNGGASLYSSLIIAFGKNIHRRDYKKAPKAPGEKEWAKRWRVLQKNPSKNCYRKYYKYADNPSDIIPADMMNTVIQPILNPNELRPYYLDKNMFDLISGRDIMPYTVMRRIGGEYFDRDYKSLGAEAQLPPIDPNIDALIAKPSRDSYGGRNVLLFHLSSDGSFRWNEDNSRTLSPKLLDELLGENWIVQHKMEQHPFMAQFNESSVNTLRVHIFSSPVSGEIDIPGACIRVGRKGNWYDNFHGGGFCVGVNLQNGKLGKVAADGKGNITTETNGIDMAANDFFVPGIEALKEFAVNIGKKVPHHYSLAADIMIDRDGSFSLIEVNIGTFDSNMYVATGSTSFGKYTEEVIDYCRKNRKKVKFVHIIPW